MNAPHSNPPKIKVDAYTRKAQGKASDPDRSAWVSANAGSGKTYVLTQRVVRLLLSGFDPSRILCLTFTKAAAAEMSNRVFETLSNWAVMEESELVNILQDVTGKTPASRQIRQARRLFARALETPGGLKIQTIHAFCEALLHQFPLEANIAGHFETLDGKAQIDLINEARRQVILQARAGNNDALETAFSQVLAAAGDQKIEQSLGEIIDKRHDFVRWIKQAGGLNEAIAGLRRMWNFEQKETSNSLIDKAFATMVMDEHEVFEIAEAGEKTGVATNIAFAANLRACLVAGNPHQRYDILARIFLTQAGDPRKTAGSHTKKLADAIPHLKHRIDEEFEHFKQTKERTDLLKQLEDSEALFTLGTAILGRFEKLKTAKGLLDFDDLIVRAADLLTHSNAHLWVQYKLDQGIDHVLVDEAQDTNPHQWQVISALVGDFFSGEGAREIERTVFAVGDEKQSIYSFQGAEPDAFADQRERLKGLAEKSGKRFSTIRLNMSFRSTPDVLSAVDKVFSHEENYAGLSRDRQATIHTTIRQSEPGIVDIWPLIAKEPISEPEDWAMPVDQLANSDPQVQLACKIADQVARWLREGTILKGKRRPIRAGDILVLVRSRDRFSLALTRELKVRNVPIAGSDRLQLTDHIVVQDLLVIGRITLLPQDDLSLAAVLKSPFYGFDEELLYQLAEGRGRISLYEALIQMAKGNETANKALEHLQTLRKRADQLPVYEFYALLLGADGGRQRILARMGDEVEDVLDAFLAQIHKHEQAGLPGLENFIDWLQMSAPEIKREFDLKTDEVKIMTVHAAKGLEAPIVFLVDKGSAPYHGRHDPSLIKVISNSSVDDSEGGFVWQADKKQATPISTASLEVIRIKAEAEYKRLLYVAMTRAADRLILCGTKGERDADKDCWHNIAMRALAGELDEHLDEAGQTAFYRWQKTTSADVHASTEVEDKDTTSVSDLPDWIDQQLLPEPKLPRPLTPSGAYALIDAQGWQAQSPLSGGDGDPSRAMLRGVAIHRLLQMLPDIGGETSVPDVASMRRDAALRYLSATSPGWSSSEIDKIMGQVFSVIESSEFNELFSPGASRAEVAISGTIELASGPRLVSGQIDRLVVDDGMVTIIDYKTNRPAPREVGEIPQSYLSQLALYRQLTRLIYPDHQVKAAFLWTEIPRLDFIPQAQLDAVYLKIAQA